MMDEDMIKRYLEPIEYFKEYLGEFIDVFVEYYGEEYRKEIEEKFNNTHFFFYQSDDDLRKKLIALESEYNSEYIQSKYKKYYDFLEANKELRTGLFKKYNKGYVKRIIHTLSEQYKKLAEEYINSDETLFMFSLKNQCSELETLLGGFDDITIYEYFTTEMEEKLNNPEVSTFEKNSILKKRKEYFEAIGINKGDYNDLGELSPSQELIEEILKIKEEVYDLYELEYCSRVYPQCIFKKETDDLGLMCDNRETLAHTHMKKEYNCVAPNVKMVNGHYKLSPELFVYVDNDDFYKDKVIIHELNHIFEMNIGSILGNEIETKTGWDSLHLMVGKKDNSIEKNYNPRKYERFSEVINEIITTEIYEEFKSRGITVFTTPDFEPKLTSSYMNHYYIVKEFFQKYKKEILESRRKCNIQIMYDAVGKENFEALNELVQEDYMSFDWTLREQLKNDLEENKDTKLTRKYNNIVSKKDLILQKMDQYHLEATQKLKR